MTLFLENKKVDCVEDFTTKVNQTLKVAKYCEEEHDIDLEDEDFRITLQAQFEMFKIAVSLSAPQSIIEAYIVKIGEVIDILHDWICRYDDIVEELKGWDWSVA